MSVALIILVFNAYQLVKLEDAVSMSGFRLYSTISYTFTAQYGFSVVPFNLQ